MLRVKGQKNYLKDSEETVAEWLYKQNVCLTANISFNWNHMVNIYNQKVI